MTIYKSKKHRPFDKQHIKSGVQVVTDLGQGNSKPNSERMGIVILDRRTPSSKEIQAQAIILSNFVRPDQRSLFKKLFKIR